MLRVRLDSRTDKDHAILLLAKQDEEGIPDGIEPWFFKGTWGNWELLGTLDVVLKKQGNVEHLRRREEWWLAVKAFVMSPGAVVNDLKFEIELPKRWKLGQIINFRALGEGAKTVNDERGWTNYPFEVVSIEEV
jgi:hypothetical protein